MPQADPTGPPASILLSVRGGRCVDFSRLVGWPPGGCGGLSGSTAWPGTSADRASVQSTLVSCPGSYTQKAHIDRGNAEQLLANLDQLSDEKVDSLLTDMLADEKDSE